MEIIDFLPEIGQYGLGGLALLLTFFLLRFAIENLASLGQKLINAFNALDNSIVAMNQFISTQTEEIKSLHEAEIHSSAKVGAALDGIEKLVVQHNTTSQAQFSKIVHTLEELSSMIVALQRILETMPDVAAKQVINVNEREEKTLEELQKIAQQVTRLTTEFESIVKKQGD